MTLSIPHRIRRNGVPSKTSLRLILKRGVFMNFVFLGREVRLI